MSLDLTNYDKKTLVDKLFEVEVIKNQLSKRALDLTQGIRALDKRITDHERSEKDLFFLEAMAQFEQREYSKVVGLRAPDIKVSLPLALTYPLETTPITFSPRVEILEDSSVSRERVEWMMKDYITKESIFAQIRRVEQDIKSMSAEERILEREYSKRGRDLELCRERVKAVEMEKKRMQRIAASYSTAHREVTLGAFNQSVLHDTTPHMPKTESWFKKMVQSLKEFADSID